MKWWLPMLACASLPQAAWSQEATTLDTIVVTARMRPENLQDVPMSVQTLSGDLLDELNLSSLYDLQFNIPGLVVNTTGLNGAGFSLRGISNQGGISLAVATHLNGVYQGASSLAIMRTFDMERVEVLKGPQGTLYGRNSTGGSINFITRPPADTLGAEVEAAYGTYATARAQGNVNVPFRSGAARIAFIASEGDGYIRNSVDERRFAENDFAGLRFSLGADLGDTTHIDVMVQRVEDNGASAELWTPSPSYLADPSDIRLTTVTLADPFLKTRDDNANVTLEFDLGAATLRAITGYARGDMRDRDDCSGLPFLQGCVRGAQPRRYRQWSEELQLLLPKRGAVDGVVGAYWSEDDLDDHLYQDIPLFAPEPITQSHGTERGRAAALFGQVNVHLSERWGVTAGARLSDEKNRSTLVGTGVTDSHVPLTGKAESNDLSWRLDLVHATTDNVRIYGGVSNGFKSGGLNETSNGTLEDFAPERLTAYEVGVKARGGNRPWRVEAAAFYYDFSDLQVDTAAIENGRLVFKVDNAARAEVYGIDANGEWRMFDRLALSGGVVWVPRREFVAFTSAAGDTLSGNTLVRAPEWSTSAAVVYDQPLRGGAWFSARLEYNYRSDYFFTPDNAPAFRQDAFGLVNLYLNFEAAGGKWYGFVSGRNLTGADYFNQVFLQSSPGYPDTYEIGIGYRF
ncbi:TonB-dependent receptor [Lysobacter sp. KIS68-7]|uniref:TonB-dependent receptor n=1 Tax=Lysobacter sp. KIS68-7 TaxID=2904252 RepID=UPI001E286EE0|nr:TonB-dependent receptor [Lysobacter sp. KIS68-7]UHQ20218.1 TonB-dependent receptor [Lysobacter sp. KIS68-7]